MLFDFCIQNINFCNCFICVLKRQRLLGHPIQKKIRHETTKTLPVIAVFIGAFDIVFKVPVSHVCSLGELLLAEVAPLGRPSSLGVLFLVLHTPQPLRRGTVLGAASPMLFSEAVITVEV